MPTPKEFKLREMNPVGEVGHNRFKFGLAGEIF